jgi:hypothetical protein
VVTKPLRDEFCGLRGQQFRTSSAITKSINRKRRTGAHK